MFFRVVGMGTASLGEKAWMGLTLIFAS